MTDAIAGCARRPPIATFNNVTPRACANSSSASRRSKVSSVKTSSRPERRVPSGRVGAPAVLPREQSAREREVREHADPQALARRQQLFLSLAAQERVLVLRTYRPRKSLLTTERVDLLNLRGPEIRVPDVAHLSFAHELVERAERLLERRDPVGSVVLVEVDHVGSQALQRAFDRLADVLAGPARLGAVAHVTTELRRQKHAIAPALERFPEERLAAALIAVDVRGVEERHARVQRGIDHGTRSVEIETAAEVVAAEADNGDVWPFLAEAAGAHGR